jgi:hypothetical protein
MVLDAILPFHPFAITLSSFLSTHFELCVHVCCSRQIPFID